MLVSYAQNYEDVRLLRAFADVAAGRYLDIGTQDPVRDSVSLACYENGWRGVHVEPVPAYAAAMRAARPDETVIEAAVSSAVGPMTLFEIPGTGLSTGVSGIAKRHAAAGWPLRELTVATVTLAGVFDHMGPEPIHWLKIDVEGMEADVIASWEDHPARPAALIIEATAPNTQEPTHESWYALVLARGYAEVLFDGLSRYFLHADHAHRTTALALSPNVFDGFQVPPSHFSAGLLQSEHAAEADAAQAKMAESMARLDEISQQLAQAERDAAEQAARDERALANAREQLTRLQHDHLALVRENGHLEGQLFAANRRLGGLEPAFAAAASALGRLEGQLSARTRRLGEVEATLVTVAGERDQNVRSALALSQQLAEVRQHSADQAHALHHEIAQLRDKIAWREGQLQQAAALLTATPRPLLGLHGLAAVAARKVLGKARIAAIANHQAAAAQWQAGALLPGAPDTLASLADNTTGGAATLMQWSFDTMDNDEPVTSVPRLLSPHDRQFIHTAYQVVLGRVPDAQGEAYYLARLRAGVHKLAILGQLRRSREGRAFIPGVAGLDRAIRHHFWATLPVIGLLVRWLTGAEGNSATHRQLRVLANAIGCLRAEQVELAGAVRQLALRATETPVSFAAEERGCQDHLEGGAAPQQAEEAKSINDGTASRDGLAAFFQSRIWNL